MRNLRCEKYNQDVDIDFHGLARANLSSEHSEREGEAPAALLQGGAMRAPLIDSKPCPHPLDHCVHRSRCVINRMCMDDPKCRKKRRANGDDPR